MLYLIGKKYNSKNIVLYRDDELAVFKNVSLPASEKIKKQSQSLYKQKDLQIIIECNLKFVNYLDVTFNLNDVLIDLIENQTTIHITFMPS